MEMGKASEKKELQIHHHMQGYQREPNENCHEFTISILKQQFGENHPKIFERGASSDYSKIKKNCERGCK